MITLVHSLVISENIILIAQVKLSFQPLAGNATKGLGLAIFLQTSILLIALFVIKNFMMS